MDAASFGSRAFLVVIFGLIWTADAADHVCGKLRGEFYFLIDSSASFKIDIEATRRLLNLWFIPRLEKIMPNSRYAIGEFNNKAPEETSPGPLGAGTLPPHVTCYQNLVPMTPDTEIIKQKMQTEILPRPTESKKHSQLDALYHGIMSDGVGWTRDDVDPDGITEVFRSVFVFTDTPQHVAGDADKIWPQQGFVPHDGSKEADCLKYDFATEDLVVNAIAIRDVFPVVIVGNHDSPAAYGHWLNWMSHLKSAFGIDGAVLSLFKYGYSAGLLKETADDLLKEIEIRSCAPDKVSKAALRQSSPPSAAETLPLPAPGKVVTAAATPAPAQAAPRPTWYPPTPKPTTTGPPQEDKKTSPGVVIGALAGVTAALGAVAASVAGFAYYRSLQPQASHIELFFEDECSKQKDVRAAV